MTYRPFVFMSGEFKVTMPAVFQMTDWNYISIATRLMIRDDVLYLTNRPNDPIDGIITYACLDDKFIEDSNLELILSSGVPSWPDAYTLYQMSDRFDVLQECVDSGLVDHLVSVNVYDPKMFDGGQKVLKVGNQHRGEGKHLVQTWKQCEMILKKEGESHFSVEPFFEGESIRVLIIGDKTFGIRVTNENSWVKNTTGADVHEYVIPDDLLKHAHSVQELFGLELLGIDYIVEESGKFHFLECNQYPGIPGFDHIMDHARHFFKSKMNEVMARSIINR